MKTPLSGGRADFSFGLKNELQTKYMVYQEGEGPEKVITFPESIPFYNMSQLLLLTPSGKGGATDSSLNLIRIVSLGFVTLKSDGRFELYGTSEWGNFTPRPVKDRIVLEASFRGYK